MIYVFFAHGFEEIEGLTVVDVLRRAELEVRSVGVGSKTVTGAHGITIHCDIIDREVDTRQMKMLVLPGGMPGTLNLEKSRVVQQTVDYAAENDLWIAAICAAPSILGRRGLLRDRTVTCFPGFESQLEGARYTASPLEIDGRYITANGPGSALPFALRLVECLTDDKERASALGDAMQYRP